MNLLDQFVHRLRMFANMNVDRAVRGGGGFFEMHMQGFEGHKQDKKGDYFVELHKPGVAEP